MRVGAQLYTLREHCQTPEGLALSLRRVADIGYRTVQVSGTCPWEAGWLREQLDRCGLTCVLTHIPADRLTGETDRVIADHRVLGCPRAGLGYWSFREEEGAGYDAFAARFVPAALALRDAGMLFMVHNHDQEFRHLADGRPILAHLAEDLPADAFGFTLDTFWVQAGGGDPAEWITRLAGRVPCVHLKDFACGRRMAVLGEGNLNLDRILAAAEDAGTEELLVEQDDCYGEDPFDCLRRSFRFLQARGLA